MSEDSIEASEDTNRLCDDTIDLIGSFRRLLDQAKLREAATTASGPCPCGRSIERHQGHQSVVSSNASNLLDGRQPTSGSRVLTSPSEIHLVLRLESWIGENGMLVVKPSLHREQPPAPAQQLQQQQNQQPSMAMECGSFGNNSTTIQPAQIPISGSSESNLEDYGDGYGGEGDYCGPSEETQKIEQRQLRKRLRQQRREQVEQQEPAVTSVTSGKPLRQQTLQPRRERLLQSKRSASATKSSAGTVKTRREQAATVATEPLQQQLTRRPRVRSGGDSTTLIRKLHRLLDVEMKRSA